MVTFIIRRLLLAIPTILVVITIVFFSVRGLGGDPAMAILGDRATPQALEAMRERLGLNKPLWKQYTSFLWDLAHGDLGRDLRTEQPVAELFKRAVPYTIDLAIWATVIGILIGVPAGILAALKWNTPLDFLGRFVGILGFSFPTFYLSIILLFIFSLTLRWFPMIGGGELDNIAERAWHLFLPALSLGLIKSAFVMRLTRSSMLNVLH